MTVWHTRIACWVPRAINTPSLFSTYCIPTATVFARTHLNVMIRVHYLSCWTFAILSVVGLIVKREMHKVLSLIRLSFNL